MPLNNRGKQRLSRVHIKPCVEALTRMLVLAISTYTNPVYCVPVHADASQWQETLQACGAQDVMRGFAPDFKPCPSFLETVRNAQRPSEDAPLELPDCGYTAFSSAEACGIVSHYDAIILYGDSFIRHLMGGLLMALRGDFEVGALKPRDAANDTVRAACRCEDQFGEKLCRHHTQWTAYTSHGFPAPCAAHHALIKYAYPVLPEWLLRGYPMSPFYLDIVQQQLARSAHTGLRVLVLFAGVLHDPFFRYENITVSRLFDTAVLPLSEMLDEWDPERVRTDFLLATVHAQQWNKPAQYLKLQANTRVLQYNKQIHEWAARLRAPVFDTFNATLNASSFDGSHYGARVNFLKAQLLLNYMQHRVANAASSTVTKG